MKRIATGWLVLMAASLMSAEIAAGQDDAALETRCEQANLAAGTRPGDLCRDVAAGLRALQPEAGMLLAGGNPVLGTASPIGSGFRFPPRLDLGVRLNLVFVDVPDVIDYRADAAEVEKLGFAVPMPQLDVAVGLFDGVELTPGTGGLGSVDLLGSLGFVVLPEGQGFDENVGAFGIGARVGVLRESFAVPGVSISGMYRWVDRVQFGDVTAGDDAQFGTDLRVLSFRAGVSKQLLVLGLAAGVGWDRYRSDIDFAVRGEAVDLPQPRIDVVPEDLPVELEDERWSVFVNGSYVFLFLNFVGELGWQQGETVLLSTGDEIESGNLFAAIGLRISL